MKKRFIILAILLVVGIPTFSASPPANVAYVLINQLALYEDNPDKTLKYLEGLTLGDTVTLLGNTATFKEGKTEQDFTRVRAPSGKVGWARTQYIASKATLAVVQSDDSLVFAEPRDVKVTGRSISSMTMVAVLVEGSTAEFSQVQGFDVPKRVLFTESTFMLPSDLSTSEADIQSAILYTVAMAAKTASVKTSLLNLAQSKYPSSIFASRIAAALSGEPPEAQPAAQEATQITVRTSSTLAAETTTKYRYDADLMFDGNPLTAWSEGSEGSGEGETIEVVFAEPMRFDEIEFMPGFFDARWFAKNVRVKQIQIELFDASGKRVYGEAASFTDQMIKQRIAVPENEIAQALFTILAVYAPEQKDLPISEISFWRRGTKVRLRSGAVGP